MEIQMFGLVFITVLCACSCSSLPASSRHGEITKLVSLLGKLKNIERVRRQQEYNHHLQQQQQQLLSGVNLSSRQQQKSSGSSAFTSPGDQQTLKALAASEARAVSDLPGVFTSPDVTNSLLLGEEGSLGLDLADGSPLMRGSYRGKAALGLDGGSSSSSSNSGEKSKRQGAWSYDYGLGGGRFGKRSYGDYGIGGGRFGRDVDHVDISDTSDADAATL